MPPICDPRFTVVIEKSCADAIACGEDVEIPIPYSIKDSDESGRFVYIHPVALLSVHLAALTKPGAAWIVLSYSENRFDCLYGNDEEDESLTQYKKEGSVPDPGKLWTMELKREMVAQMERMEEGVYRPRISHWLYVLRRMDLDVA
jgi:hypothetical protein